jgi:hypothetical protein
VVRSLLGGFCYALMNIGNFPVSEPDLNQNRTRPAAPSARPLFKNE